MKRKIIILFLLLLPSLLEAQSGPLTLRENGLAPALKHVKWLKGEPVFTYKSGQVYVVEFSATWCAPCRKMIPHLSELSRKYGSRLTVISVYIWQNKKASTPADTSYYQAVRKLIAGQGRQMDFHIAIDLPGQQTAADWGMDRTTDAIPHSFVVDGKGKIAWEGHPMELDSIAGHVLNGSLASYLSRQKNTESLDQALIRILKLKGAGNYPMALMGMDSLIQANPGNQSLYGPKYQLLAGTDDAQANRLLKQLLKAQPSDLDWYHLLADATSLPKQPDLPSALLIADLALSKAETVEIRSNIIFKKGNIYHRMGDITSAIQAYKSAIILSREGEDQAQTDQFEQKLAKVKMQHSLE